MRRQSQLWWAEETSEHRQCHLKQSHSVPAKANNQGGIRFTHMSAEWEELGRGMRHEDQW